MSAYEILPGGTGAAVRMKRGQSLEIRLGHGLQVVDFWSMIAEDFGEYGSMPHSRSHWFRLTPHAGDPIVTNRRNPIATLTEDSTDGAHDTLLPCCDAKRYNQYGFEGYHRNCSDNFREGLTALGIEPPPIFLPINLFMQVPIGADGRLMIVPPRAKPGDHVVLRAEMDMIGVMSACPFDLLPLNGPDCKVNDVDYRVF
jgi:uncharacterized protein YcgI (DUF1989 family)